MTLEALLVTVPEGRRGAVRYELKLGGDGLSASDDSSDALIHNLSSSGLLLETKASLSVGQEVVIALPEAESSPARVVWENDKFFGCVFDQPLSPAAVSAARLKSEPESGPPSMSIAVERTNPIVFTPFGSRLQRMRKERGLSVVELARRMKVSRPTVWSWEAGKSSPRASKFASLSAIFDVTEEELRGSGAGADYDGLPRGTARGADALQTVIAAMKARIAEVAGTSSEKVKIVIEI